MGATWISWRTTTVVIITILQIRALISVKTKAVTGVEGQRFDFRCDYRKDLQYNTKYFCYDNDDKVSTNPLVRTAKHDQCETNERFSLHDNHNGAFFIVSVDKLILEDSGTYRCGVYITSLPDEISFIKLNVTTVNGSPIFPKDVTVDKLHLPLFVTAVMCITAMLFICMFTLGLLLTVKHQRPGPRQNRETSSDYETMMPVVTTEPELCCNFSAPDCADISALPAPPPDLCSHFTSNHRDSTVTLGLGEYVDVDGPKHICQYQHLDPSRLEEHVYHSLHGNCDPKDVPLGVKEQINSYTVEG
ncbi:uncharacterized protein LOC117959303 isoform X2 [Etheostoma cragini]|uniref:uncharacterized protein LOC117959303 isoform X2 n=1 Tax=Etheostoma cragini TaxID=417921 RepID=UPI00155E31A6|nr:uncharacterized protein LOC117959303 isoform X2 [Etheostoma cragini]